MNDVLTAITASVLANGILVWIFKTWFAEQIRQKVSFEYGQRLETIKAQLKSEHETALEQLRADNATMQAVQTAANASLAEGHRAGHERRLKGIDSLWRAFVEIRDKTPGAVSMSDNLIPSEYHLYFTNTNLMQLHEDLRARQFAIELSEASAEVERSRPFIGEHLYGMFFVYRAIVGRLCFLFSEGTPEKGIPDWRNNAGVKQMLSSILSPEEVESLLARQVSTLHVIRMTLEAKTIEHAQRIISGEAAAEFGLGHSKKIADALAQWARPEQPSGG